MARDLLEQRKEHREHQAAPQALQSNNQNRVEFIVSKILFLSDEKAANKTLCKYKQSNSKERCLSQFLRLLLIAIEDTYKSYKSCSRYNYQG